MYALYVLGVHSSPFLVWPVTVHAHPRPGDHHSECRDSGCGARLLR